MSSIPAFPYSAAGHTKLATSSTSFALPTSSRRNATCVASTKPRTCAARKAARRFADKWTATYPAAVRCLQVDLDDLLTFFRFSDPTWRRATRTTNAIERRFCEVRRRTRPMGVFSDKTSLDRILFAVFTGENQNQGVPPLFLLTH